MRLSDSTLSQLPAAIARPDYDRSKVQPAIVHLGTGAFHRAHEAMYTDAVLRSGDLTWGITGASLNSDAVKRALAPQDGLYALTEHHAGGESTRVIGALTQLLGGAADAPALLDRMSAPATRIVSITVTEKGYYLDPATGELQLQAPPIVADLAAPDLPRTILGLIVQSLARRRRAGLKPFTVLSCDNLPHNGQRARAAVCAFARELDADLAAWIAGEVAFPCTMVDRITPATTDADRAHAQQILGLEDAWPVVTEQFTQWVIEDHFTLGRPDWTVGGAVFSNEIEAWENMKLRCLNGAHSTLAYLGQLTGRETVAEAMQMPLITGILDALWLEVREVLKATAGVDTGAYVDSLRSRFRNPALKHRTAQIAMDGSQKLPQRLLAPLRDRLARGLPAPTLATAIAAWMHYVLKVAQDPSGTTLSDPMSADLLAAARRSSKAEAIVGNLLALTAIFGTDLPADAAFRTEMIKRFKLLARDPALSCAARIEL
jgi:fructuronate reductase